MAGANGNTQLAIRGESPVSSGTINGWATATVAVVAATTTVATATVATATVATATVATVATATVATVATDLGCLGDMAAGRAGRAQDGRMDVSTREADIRARLADIGGDRPGAAERALLARLIRSFAGNVPGKVDRLAELLRGGDPEAVRDHAHGLKGSASNIGADTLSGIFAEVEHSARDGVIPDADMTLGRICAEQALVLGLLDGLAREMEPNQ